MRAHINRGLWLVSKGSDSARHFTYILDVHNHALPVRAQFAHAAACLNPSSFGFNSLNGSSSPLGRFVANRDDRRMARVMIEISIKIFERSIRRFGIKEVHDEQEPEIKRREYCAALADNLCDSHGGYTYIEAISYALDSRRSKLRTDESKKLSRQC